MLIVSAGCTATDGTPDAAVPTPESRRVAEVCAKLDEALPDTLDGLDRNDPEPGSELTAGWGGDPAIVLRCGVPRPSGMSDPEADAVEVSGVDWLLEDLEDGSFRFTTTYREAYVEVSLPEEHAKDVTPLMPLGGPIRKTVPSSL
ncbi:DUF3515 domain-containing protein [Streptomyces sp. GC420]|uniref:DUF3515 domain-containing protein n=1 Tax=Streptomyces sp. GC420 TaxID=2697568 RepID=UPI0028BD318B|nr:DUF3515 domain-containing protein [Streptomyces sp. GC420]